MRKPSFQWAGTPRQTPWSNNRADAAYAGREEATYADQGAAETGIATQWVGDRRTAGQERRETGNGREGGAGTEALLSDALWVMGPYGVMEREDGPVAIPMRIVEDAIRQRKPSVVVGR